MATRIRLRRMGAKKRPYYRVVVADQRAPRDGRFIEIIGKYHPLEDPSLIDIDEERALHWLGVGAQPSETVQVLLAKVGIWEKFRPGEKLRERGPKAAEPSVKARATAAAQPPTPEAHAPEADAPAPAEEAGVEVFGEETAPEVPSEGTGE